LALRDQASLELSRLEITENQAFAALKKLREAYWKHSTDYDHLVSEPEAKEYWSHVREFENAIARDS
jgi:hypothetical protein